jgi:hypothetical protein
MSLGAPALLLCGTHHRLRLAAHGATAMEHCIAKRVLVAVSVVQVCALAAADTRWADGGPAPTKSIQRAVEVVG